MSVDGTAVQYVESPTTIAINRWYNVVGRFWNGGTQTIWVNGNSTTITWVGAPTGIFNSTAQFEVMRYAGGGGGAVYMTGYTAHIWLAAYPVSDYDVWRLWRMGKILYGAT